MVSTSLLSSRGPREGPSRFALPIAAATAFSIAACTSGSDGTARQTLGSPLPSTAALSSSPDMTNPSTSSGIPSATESAAAAEQGPTGGTPIRVTIGDTVLTGRLWDNATARDLIAQLPLRLTFSDLNNLEKIARLPRQLSTDGVPEGDDPVPQDIGYYAPGGDLVFYYGDVGYFKGIVRIGQFNGSMEVIANATGDFMATVEVAE